MIVSPLARFILAILAVILLVPVLCIPFQDVETLEQFHNRKLRQWPAGSTFAHDPAQYFRKTKDWLADRAFPIIQASTFQKKVLFYGLGTAPQRRITMGKNGFIFLNGNSDSDINCIFSINCGKAHSEPYIKAFKDGLPALAHYSQSRKITVDIVVFPTMASIYGDYLPESVPEDCRSACMERTNGRSPLVDLQKHAPVTLVYPLLEMKAARDDEAFFPKANWHADGLSLRVARDAYLARLGVTTPVQDTIELGEGPSELLSFYGIMKNFPVYTIHNPHLREDGDRAAALKQRIADLFIGPIGKTRVFDNTQPIIPESVLVISDSFGERASAVFAGAFQHLMWVCTNDMDHTRVVELIDRASQLAAVDRIIIMATEGNTPLVAVWSKALAASLDPSATSAILRNDSINNAKN